MTCTCAAEIARLQTALEMERNLAKDFERLANAQRKEIRRLNAQLAEALRKLLDQKEAA